MKFPHPSFALAAFITCSILSQLLLKAAGLYAASKIGFADKYLLNPWLHTSLCCLALSFPCWMYTLRRIPLSAAYPWTAFIYVVTPLFSVALWGERVSWFYAPGIACIIGGIILITSCGRAEKSHARK